MEDNNLTATLTKVILTGASLIRHKKKTLNTKEYPAWLCSEEGQGAQMDAVAWDIMKVPEIWRKHSQIIQSRRDSVYQQCLTISAELEDSVEAITTHAEKLCMDRWVYPPHWTTSIYCDDCGEVLAPNDTVGCFICKFSKEISNAMGKSEASLRAAIQEGVQGEEAKGICSVSGDESSSDSFTEGRPQRVGFLPSLERSNGKGGR